MEETAIMDNVLAAPIDIFVMVAYFMAVVGFGLYFGKYASTTKDFYFGGQRFAWWLIAFSGIATTIGSYSFVKYSSAGYKYGISSTQTYLNDWFWMPVLMFLWLPVIYYMRIQSVPEYFERRFGRTARTAATLFILLYLISYVGINLLTLGTALETLLGWPVFAGALLAGLTVTVYVFAGGQTSVIMTDLVQGITLLIVGLGIFFFGIYHVGGPEAFWSLLPMDHRFLFSKFSEPDNFSFVGIYAQDGISNTAAFVLMNQGMMMRFLSMRSVTDARKMAVFWILILYPLAAITVSGGGWIAMALVNNGELPAMEKADDAFIKAAHLLCQPGIFGFVLAALMAALMSTADTLINAVSAVFLNDIYKPYVRPVAEDKHYLRIARITSLCVAGIGLALVPLFDRFETVYQAHAYITASIPPPVVVAILLGLFWKRFNTTGALASLIGGGLLIAITMIPACEAIMLKPFAFGMGEGSFKFVRAFFGMVVCTGLGVGGSLLTPAQPMARILGLVNGTQLDAMRLFKGSDPNRKPGEAVYLSVKIDPTLSGEEASRVPAEWMPALAANEGDLAYVCDRRWWFGGLRSVHTRLGEASSEPGVVLISPEAAATAHFTEGDAVYVQKLF